MTHKRQNRSQCGFRTAVGEHVQFEQVIFIEFTARQNVLRDVNEVAKVCSNFDAFTASDPGTMAAIYDENDVSRSSRKWRGTRQEINGHEEHVCKMNTASANTHSKARETSLYLFGGASV